MKNSRFLLPVVLAFGLSMPASAADVAVVDLRRVLAESIVGKAARNNVDVEVKKSEAKLASMKSEFDKARLDLEKQSAILSGSALEGKREALEKKGKEVSRLAQDMREKIMRLNDAEIGRVAKDIEMVVKNLAAERKYTAVIERDERVVLYADERLDITPEVIQILDKKKVAL